MSGGRQDFRRGSPGRWRLGLLLLGLWLALAACGGGAEPALEGQLDRVLAASWQFYRLHFIAPDGRVVRPENGGDSISEGQAYALLRAVWSNDQATFDRVYGWTEANLSQQQTKGRHLLAWRYGPDEQGCRRILDGNSATDADLDYALALMLAGRRWGGPEGGRPDYQAKARLVLRDILEHCTCRDPRGRLWLTPGDWTPCRLPLLLNPSYFAPAAYGLFHDLTGDRRWLELRDSAYLALAQLSRGLGREKGVGLVPDWCLLQAGDAFTPAPDRSADFGWDAIRVPWRVGLAGWWRRDRQAQEFLQRTIIPFALGEWSRQGRLAAIYSYQGQPMVDYESPVLYAAVVAAALAVGDRPLAREAAVKILAFYREAPDGGYFNRPDDYYGNNWAWLGLAAYRGRIVSQ